MLRICWVVTFVAFTCLSAACSSSAGRSSTLESVSDASDEVKVTTIATGLRVPWGLAFTPDGKALVTERDSGRLLSVDSSGSVEELQRLPANGIGESGLLGIALSPNYESDGYIYA